MTTIFMTMITSTQNDHDAYHDIDSVIVFFPQVTRSDSLPDTVPTSTASLSHSDGYVQALEGGAAVSGFPHNGSSRDSNKSGNFFGNASSHHSGNHTNLPSYSSGGGAARSHEGTSLVRQTSSETPTLTPEQSIILSAGSAASSHNLSVNNPSSSFETGSRSDAFSFNAQSGYPATSSSNTNLAPGLPPPSSTHPHHLNSPNSSIPYIPNAPTSSTAAVPVPLSSLNTMAENGNRVNLREHQAIVSLHSTSFSAMSSVVLDLQAVRPVLHIDRQPQEDDERQQEHEEEHDDEQQ
jgi:hypothetical protein